MNAEFINYIFSVSYFLKSNKTKPKLVKKNRGGLIKAGHTDLRKNGLFN